MSGLPYNARRVRVWRTFAEGEGKVVSGVVAANGALLAAVEEAVEVALGRVLHHHCQRVHLHAVEAHHIGVVQAAAVQTPHQAAVRQHQSYLFYEWRQQLTS